MHLLAAPGHAYNLSAPGEISTGESGEISTGGNWGIFNRRLQHTFHLYLNPLRCQEHVFRDANTMQLLLAMLGIALWQRRRPLLFAWCFLLVSLLPVAFM